MGAAFTGVLASHGIAISTDCRGASRDDVFVGRLWRSVKYGEVNLRAYDTVSDAGASIGRYLDFYVGRRLHSSVGCAAPDQAYFNPLAFRAAAYLWQKLHLSTRNWRSDPRPLPYLGLQPARQV